MPDIEAPRMAVEPGRPSSSVIKTLVTAVATSAAGGPLQWETSAACGAETSGAASRDSARRATSPPTATPSAIARTAQEWRALQAMKRAIKASPPRSFRARLEALLRIQEEGVGGDAPLAFPQAGDDRGKPEHRLADLTVPSGDGAVPG